MSLSSFTSIPSNTLSSPSHTDISPLKTPTPVHSTGSPNNNTTAMSLPVSYPSRAAPTEYAFNTHFMITRAKNGIFKRKACLANVSSDQSNEPVTVSQVLSNRRWRQAMPEEFQPLIGNNTWKLVPLSHGMKVVDNKWVLYHI